MKTSTGYVKTQSKSGHFVGSSDVTNNQIDLSIIIDVDSFVLVSAV